MVVDDVVVYFVREKDGEEESAKEAERVDVVFREVGEFIVSLRAGVEGYG